jgi:hypothetical protein
MTPARSPTRPPSSVAKALALALFASGLALPAHAVEDGRSAATRSVEPGATETRRTADRANDASNLFDRWGERLRGVPLRPVRIGTTPRIPSDPEPGVGVVVRIPF